MKETEIDTLINFWKEKYRILNDWRIEYSNDTNMGELKTCIYPILKHAIICKWQPVCKGELNPLELYVKHEILHIAISAMRQDESEILGLEELFVQDLCRLIKH